MRLGKLFGIPISLHLTFILFVAFLGMVYAFQGGAKAAISGVSFILGGTVTPFREASGHLGFFRPPI